MGLRKLLFLFFAFVTSGLLSACSEFDYYLHTVGGHMEVMAERKSIPDILNDRSTSEELRERLRKIAWIRHFASDRLDLPENGSYHSYVELDRPYVVWNVVATPELSLEPLVWCFPFAGCISYRGYFELNKAREFADLLRDEGYDITVSGVPAYSTLNWFDDPALSTFSNWPTSAAARLIFHELAHQKLYVTDDTAFNESFATAVELAGVDLWLERFGNDDEKTKYSQRLEREKQFLDLTMETRQDLELIYGSEMTDPEKRQRKEDVFSDLRQRYDVIKEGSWNGYAGYDRWFQTLNNAKFASVNSYHRWVPAFKLVMKQEKNHFPDFYRRCEAISRLPQKQRAELLDRLNREYHELEDAPQLLQAENSES